MAERLKALDLKSGVPVTVPGVRIPPCPFLSSSQVEVNGKIMLFKVSRDRLGTRLFLLWSII